MAEQDPEVDGPGYDPSAFPPFAVAVDIVALALDPSLDHVEVLTVRRGVEPSRGMRALPGGFVRPEESVTEAAWRELAEETGLGPAALPAVHLEQLATYGAVDRDPRMRVVSVAHLALSPDRPVPTAGGDAADAEWVPVERALAEGLAFDHADMVHAGMSRLGDRLEDTTLATTLVGPRFTLGELQAVYEAVWGVPLQRANFRRKVLATPGFVQATDATRTGRTGGAPATVHVPGGGARLVPPMLRPT